MKIVFTRKHGLYTEYPEPVVLIRHTTGVH